MFKIGDFVKSHTDDVFIGLIVDEGLNGFEVAWHDGDFTYSETEKSIESLSFEKIDNLPTLKN